MTVGLTPHQSRCLKVIEAYMAEHDLSPSFAEIGEALGTASKSTVHRLIHTLVDRGFIEILPYRNRSIRLVDRDTLTVKITPKQMEFLRLQAAGMGEPLEVLHQAIIEDWIEEVTERTTP